MNNLPVNVIQGKTYTEEEVLLLDRFSRGKTYLNQRSKNRFFCHCVVQDAETKKVSVILSNVYNQKMTAFALESFYGNVIIDGKTISRFIHEAPPENLGIKVPVKQPAPVQRIHEYEQEETKQRFKITKENG